MQMTMRWMRMSNSMVVLLVLATAVAGCSSSTSPNYPDAYHQALLATPASPPPSDAAQRFAQLYELTDQPGYEQRTRAFYAPRLYFNDTLTTLGSADQIVEHLGRLHDGGSRIDVEIDDVLTNGTDLYVRWTMDASFSALGSARTSRTIGISQLRFDTDGRVVLQQDFWDPVEGFYRFVPVLGDAIESVRRRFDAR